MPVITIKWIIIYQHQVTVLACTSSMVTVIACTIGIVTVSTCTIRMVTVLTCTSSMVTALACTSGIVTVWHVLVAWLQYWQLQYTKRHRWLTHQMSVQCHVCLYKTRRIIEMFVPSRGTMATTDYGVSPSRRMETPAGVRQQSGFIC